MNLKDELAKISRLSFADRLLLLTAICGGFSTLLSVSLMVEEFNESNYLPPVPIVRPIEPLHKPNYKTWSEVHAFEDTDRNLKFRYVFVVTNSSSQKISIKPADVHEKLKDKQPVLLFPGEKTRFEFVATSMLP